MKKLALFVLGLLLFSGEGFAQTSHERIEKGAAAFKEAYNAGDTEALANFYTDDAVLMLPTGQTIAGKEAITTHYRRGAEAGTKLLDLHPVEWFESGDLALDVGDYALTLPDGTRAAGQFVVVVQRNKDGDWRLHRVIWNVKP